MPPRISAVQHLRRLRGGSQSHLLRASDGASYVTKFQNNPQHIRVLANEMLAARLGLALGLPMPRVEVIDVSDWLITDTSELRIQLGGAELPCQSAKQLASLYLGTEMSGLTVDYLPRELLESVRNIGILRACLPSTSGRATPMGGKRFSRASRREVDHTTQRSLTRVSMPELSTIYD